jgi:adenylate cyclase class IV
MTTPSATSSFFIALGDIAERMKRYASTEHKNEVERLFLIDVTIDDLVAKVVPSGRFEVVQQVTQDDLFLDVFHDGRPLCADTDHYVRIRREKSRSAVFVGGELKIGYPGPASARNIRPAEDQKLTEEDIQAWHHILTLQGFQLEREYHKHRTIMRSTGEFGNHVVELEIDGFTEPSSDGKRNGGLGNHNFVSFSVEVTGSHRRSAEQAIDKAVRYLDEQRCYLTEVNGNYEDIFYGRIRS